MALDADGDLAGAFPLSAVSTRHQVRVEVGPVLHAMCAVDALGIPAMVGQPGVIISTDRTTGQTITVHVTDGRLAFAGPVVGVTCEGCPPLPDLMKRYETAGRQLYVCPICRGHQDRGPVIQPDVSKLSCCAA